MNKTVSEKTPRTTGQASPMRPNASQTEAPGIGAYRLCECGCGQKFIPAKKHHIYYSDNCRRAAWISRSAGVIAISKLRKENAVILARLDRIEAWIAKQDAPGPNYILTRIKEGS